MKQLGDNVDHGGLFSKAKSRCPVTSVRPWVRRAESLLGKSMQDDVWNRLSRSSALPVPPQRGLCYPFLRGSSSMPLVFEKRPPWPTPAEFSSGQIVTLFSVAKSSQSPRVLTPLLLDPDQKIQENPGPENPLKIQS